MENYDSNIMPSSNNSKELEVRIHKSCVPKFSCKGLNLCVGAERGECCVLRGWKVCAPSEGWGLDQIWVRNRIGGRREEQASP